MLGELYDIHHACCAKLREFYVLTNDLQRQQPDQQRDRLDLFQRMRTNVELPIYPAGTAKEPLRGILSNLKGPSSADVYLSQPKDILLFAQQFYEQWKHLHAAQVANQTERTEHFSQLVDSFRPLGMINEATWDVQVYGNQFDTVLLHAGAIPRMLKRVEYLINLHKTGVAWDSLAIVGSERKLDAKTDRYNDENIEKISELYHSLTGKELDTCSLSDITEADFLRNLVMDCKDLPEALKRSDSIRVIPAKLIQDPSVPKTDPGTSHSLMTLATASSELGDYVFGKKVLSVSTQQFAQRQALDAIWCAMQVCGENNTFKLPEMVLATGPALEIDGIIQENDKTLAQELGKLVYASYKVLGFPVDQWKAAAEAEKRAGGAPPLAV